MSDPGWIALATAGTALAGGFLGAMLQGTSSVRRWRRQTRLDAYAKFIAAEHRFHNAAIDVLAAAGTQHYDASRTELLDAQLALGRAGSLVSIAGPMSCVASMVRLTAKAGDIAGELGSPDAADAAAAEDAQPGGYRQLAAWIDAAEEFEATARAVLATKYRNGYPWISRIVRELRECRFPAAGPAAVTRQAEDQDRPGQP